MENEIQLIEKAKLGNKSALNSLFTASYPLLKGYVIKMTGDPEISQDIMQEAMLKAALNIKKFEPRAKFSTWLIKIASNVYIDYTRKQKPYEIIDDTLVDMHQNTEDEVLSKLNYNEILKILQSISYEKRMVFILKHYHGYKYEEIAEILNCPVGTVRSRLHNCIKQLVLELERRNLINE